MAEERKGRKAFTPVHVVHPIPPVFAADSEILILGSFPSVKSREQQFFYGHPQNRFWRVLAGVFGGPVPESIDEKRAFLLAHHVAVWDVIRSCTITGSSDTSIRDVQPNRLEEIIAGSRVGTRIFTNGAKAWSLYRKYLFRDPASAVYQIPATKLPSTSPANAVWSLQRLTEAWREAILRENGQNDESNPIQR